MHRLLPPVALLLLASLSTSASSSTASSASSASEQWKPVFTGFTGEGDNALSGSIALFANPHAAKPAHFDKGMAALLAQDTKDGFHHMHPEAANELLGHLPLASRGFDEVRAGAHGFVFRKEATGQVVYCARDSAEDGQVVGDGAAKRFEFQCAVDTDRAATGAHAAAQHADGGGGHAGGAQLVLRFARLGHNKAQAGAGNGDGPGPGPGGPGPGGGGAYYNGWGGYGQWGVSPWMGMPGQVPGWGHGPGDKALWGLPPFSPWGPGGPGGVPPPGGGAGTGTSTKKK